MQRPTLVAVSTKARFKRVVPKSYSYRYEIGTTAGPVDQPLVQSGCAIIETRYRGRSATWNVSASMMSEEKFTVRGAYVAPSPDNPMAYPPKPAVRAPAQQAPVSPRTPVKPAPVLLAPTPVASESPAPPPAPAPAPAPAPRTPARPERSTPRADPAGPPSEAEVRAYTIGRKFGQSTAPRPR